MQSEENEHADGILDRRIEGRSDISFNLRENSKGSESLTIVVQQAFSRLVPQQPKKDTTKMTHPMTMMQMGIVCGLNAVVNAKTLPISDRMRDPTTMSRIPPSCKARGLC